MPIWFIIHGHGQAYFISTSKALIRQSLCCTLVKEIDLCRPDATAGPAAVTKDEEALMAAVNNEDTKSRRRAAKLANRRERAVQLTR